MQHELSGQNEWVIHVPHAQDVRIAKGCVYEVGRKPLRPIPSNGYERIEIEDRMRSMSKRHALITVNEEGNITIRDLRSTNGTYFLCDDGKLRRIMPEINVSLPSDNMTVQFGDVAVVVESVPTDSHEDKKEYITNLFSRANNSNMSHEPVIADLSVDDILDLRAGEPTGLFAVSSSSLKHSQDDNAHNTSDVDEVAHNDKADVQLEFIEKDKESCATENDFNKAQRDLVLSHDEEQEYAQKQHEEVARSLSHQENDQELHPVGRLTIDVAYEQSDMVNRDLFTDAKVYKQAENNADLQSNSAAEVVSETDNDIAVSSLDDRNQVPLEKQHDESVSNMALEHNESADNSLQDSNLTANNNDTLENKSNSVSSEEYYYLPDSSLTAQQTDQPNQTAADYSQYQSRGDIWTNNEADMQYKPIFEPGSVFERVSSGAYRDEDSIEVAGFSSKDAQRSTDFSKQFEMAKHQELIPFLAMNPYLYDDLYAWLEARADRDLERTLALNSGYQEYRKNIGK